MFIKGTRGTASCSIDKTSGLINANDISLGILGYEIVQCSKLMLYLMSSLNLKSL